MGSRTGEGPAGGVGELAAGIEEALEVERDRIGPLGIWYDSNREWLEGMAEVAHLWGAPDVDAWIADAGSDRDVWNATARRQATIWTVDADGVIGGRSLSFVQAARIRLDPLGTAAGAGVEPRLTPLWYSQAMPHAYRYFFDLVEESTVPRAFTELSHNGWEPQRLAPSERFGWEMIPVWVWRQAAEFAAKWDDMPEALEVAEPPWSDPLVLEVSEWWARRQTEAFEAELDEMAGSFRRRLERLGLELTTRAARCGLGPAVLERTAFTVRREGLAQEDVYDTLTECAQVMKDALTADADGDSRTRPAVPPAQPPQLPFTEDRDSQHSNRVPLTGSRESPSEEPASYAHEVPDPAPAQPQQLPLTDLWGCQHSDRVLLTGGCEGPSDEPAGCVCGISDPASQRMGALAQNRLRALKSGDPLDPETSSARDGCARLTGGVRRKLMELHVEVTAAAVVNRARRAAQGHEALAAQLAMEDHIGIPGVTEQVAAAMMLGVAAESLSASEALELLEQALNLDRCCDAVEDLRADLERRWDYWAW